MRLAITNHKQKGGENIRIGKSGATDEEVMEAARLANCDEFVNLLPDKYNTNIA